MRRFTLDMLRKAGFSEQEIAKLQEGEVAWRLSNPSQAEALDSLLDLGDKIIEENERMLAETMAAATRRSLELAREEFGPPLRLVR